MTQLSDYIVRWALKRGVHDLPFPPSGPTTVDLGTYTIDNSNGNGDSIDLGEGAHILSPVACTLAAIDFDVEEPTGDTYLTTDPWASYDGETWQTVGGGTPDTTDPDVKVGTVGVLPGPFDTTDVPRTIYSGVLVVPRFVRVRYEWGTNIGPDASATFSVTAVAT